MNDYNENEKGEFSGDFPAENGLGEIKIEFLSKDGDVISSESIEAEAPVPSPAPAPPPAPEPAPAPERVEDEETQNPPVSGRRRGKSGEEFEVDFDFDGEYGDAEEKIVRRGRSKRTGCLSGVLYFIFIICISVVLASLGWMWATDVLGLSGDDISVTVTVPKEAISTVTREEENDEGEKVEKTVSVADIDYIADLLYDNGLIKYRRVFKIFSSFSHAEEKIKAGTYVLNTGYDYRALIYGMNPSAGVPVEIDITIPEGYTVHQIVSYLDSQGVCDEADLWDALANYDFDYDFLDDAAKGDRLRLEGYLFPDTYTFYLGDSAPRVINKLLANFNRKWTEEMSLQAEELGLTQREVLTVASMIEKEAGGDVERAAIASVIYNRLNHPEGETYGYLQIDATIYYAIAETGEEFSTEVDSPYNTYKYAGLPAGPIANPGLASIKAALSPDDTNYFYYALGKDRLHRFFETYEEHTAFVHSDEYGG